MTFSFGSLHPGLCNPEEKAARAFCARQTKPKVIFEVYKPGPASRKVPPLILQKQIQSEGPKALGGNEAFSDAIMPLSPGDLTTDLFRTGGKRRLSQ